MKRTANDLFMSLGLVVATLAGSAAWAQQPETKPVDPQARRAELRKMCDEALATVYKAKPAVKGDIAKAAGYGCFTSFGMSFFVGCAGGQGLVHSNKDKTDTYMNMAQASGGLDFGIKHYREVLVFKDAKTLQQFVDKGWEFGGAGTATAAAGGKGAKAEQTQIDSSAIDVYPLTNTGLAVGVAAAGRKYWKDDALNAAK